MNADQLKNLFIDFGLMMIVAALVYRGNTPIKDLPLPLRRIRRAQNVTEWLDIATGNLAPSAQARIRAEIEAHYTEAVQFHQDAGLPEANAQTAALADLGHAHAAARRYDREYLTKEEAGRVARYFEDRDDDVLPSFLQRNWLQFLNRNWFLLLLLCATILTYRVFWFHPQRYPLSLLFMLASLLFTYLVSRTLWQRAPELPGQKITPARLSWLILLDSLEMLGWAVFWTSIFYMFTDNDAPGLPLSTLYLIFCASMAAKSSIKVIKLLHLRRKVLSAGIEELNLPPQNPAAA